MSRPCLRMGSLRMFLVPMTASLSYSYARYYSLEGHSQEGAKAPGGCSSCYSNEREVHGEFGQGTHAETFPAAGHPWSPSWSCIPSYPSSWDARSFRGLIGTSRVQNHLLITVLPRMSHH